MDERSIARPYAKAAFECAHQSNQVTDWSAALDILAKVLADPNIIAVLKNPHVNPKQVAKVLIDELSKNFAMSDNCHVERSETSPSSSRRSLVANNAPRDDNWGISKQLKNFIDLLAEKRRLNVLPEIFQLFEEHRTALEKTVTAEVSSPYPITLEQQDKLAAALKIRLQRNVTIKTKINGASLGGVIVKVGDLIIDGSVENTLSRLLTHLNV